MIAQDPRAALHHAAEQASACNYLLLGARLGEEERGALQDALADLLGLLGTTATLLADSVRGPQEDPRRARHLEQTASTLRLRSVVLRLGREMTR